MSLTFSQFGKYDVFAIKGRLTISDLPHIAPELSRHVQNSTGRHLGLDLSAVEMLDSSALRLLVNIKKHADTVNADFVLLAPSEPVLNVLKGTNLDRVFRILGGINELEAMIASDFIRQYSAFTVAQNGILRLSLSCAVCGSGFVTGYLVNQSDYIWEWKGQSLFPSATDRATSQAFDVHAVLPVACTECFMCSLDLKQFNVVKGEHVAIHATLDDASRSMLTKAIKKRKKLIDDLGVAVGEKFFEHPRNPLSSYGIYLLAESCAQTMAARKSTADAFGIGYLNYLASKYAPAEHSQTVLDNSRTWLSLALSEKQACTPLQVAQAHYILMIASMGLKKMKEASKMYAEFESLMTNQTTDTSPGINNPAFWFAQAKNAWNRQIDNSAGALKVGM